MTTAEQPMASQAAAAISARLDRLPATRYIWQLVLLLSLGGCFEFYDLFLTAYIGPGLVRSGLFSRASISFFGFSGLASFVGLPRTNTSSCACSMVSPNILAICSWTGVRP